MGAPGIEPGTLPRVNREGLGSQRDYGGWLSRFRRKKKTGFPPPSPALLAQTYQSEPEALGTTVSFVVAFPAFCDTTCLR